MLLRRLWKRSTTSSTAIWNKRNYLVRNKHDVQEEERMNVRECYEIMNADYEDVKRRFLSDSRIRRFSLLFLQDGSMNDLRAAMEQRDCEKAFQAAHTLKGICLNLGFTGLFAPVNRITEMLRAGDYESASGELGAVEDQYDTTIKGLRELEQL